MIERDIERAVVNAVSALRMDGMDIDGFWQAVPDGSVKGKERPDARAILRVVAAPRSFESFSSPRADIAVAMALTVRADTAPTGDALAEYTEPLMCLLQGWQESIDSVRNDFTVDGFTPCGLRLDGGDVSSSGDPRHCWVVTQKFTVRGIVRKGASR